MLNKMKTLYGEDKAKELYNRVLSLIHYFQDFTISDGKRYKFSERDIVLIAYPDHLSSDNKKISSLDLFLKTYYHGLINSVHLLPFYPYSSDDGFSVIDYKKVDSNLEGWEGIRNLGYSYRLMFDAVINHISAESDWFQGYLECNPEYYDFFIDFPNQKDVSTVVRPRTHPLLTKFKRKNGKESYVWTTFSADQIDLNYSSPEVLYRIIELLLFYVSNGAKLIRLDAIAYLWKKLGTSCIHLPETHLVIEILREVLDLTTPEVSLITETNVPHKENISYFGNGLNEAQMVYQFSLPPLIAYSILKQEIDPFVDWLKSLRLPKSGATFFNFTASHDGIGVRPLEGLISAKNISWLAKEVESKGGKVSYKSNEDGTKSPYELNISYVSLLKSNNNNDKFILSQALMLTLPGVPGIYFSSLIGAENDLKGLETKGYNRAINREKFDYDLIKNKISNNKSVIEIFETYRFLLSIRTSYNVFSPHATLEVEKLASTVLLIKRTIEAKTLYAFFNFGDKQFKVSLANINSNKTKNLFTQKIISEDIDLQAFGFLWLLSV